MKTILITLLLSLAIRSGAIGLDFGNPSTNNFMCSWYKYTNGPVSRYSGYWTPQTNTDSGTNWTQTTNWTQFFDVNSSTTNSPLLYWTTSTNFPSTNTPSGSVAPMRLSVPTNTLVTIIITVPGGYKCPPFMVQTNLGISMLFTNQPVYPIPR